MSSKKGAATTEWVVLQHAGACPQPACPPQAVLASRGGSTALGGDLTLPRQDRLALFLMMPSPHTPARSCCLLQGRLPHGPTPCPPAFLLGPACSLQPGGSTPASVYSVTVPGVGTLGLRSGVPCGHHQWLAQDCGAGRLGWPTALPLPGPGHVFSCALARLPHCTVASGPSGGFHGGPQGQAERKECGLSSCPWGPHATPCPFPPQLFPLTPAATGSGLQGGASLRSAETHGSRRVFPAPWRRAPVSKAASTSLGVWQEVNDPDLTQPPVKESGAKDPRYVGLKNSRASRARLP